MHMIERGGEGRLPREHQPHLSKDVNYYKKFKTTLQKELFWHNLFCKNYKTISLQSKFLHIFSCKQGQTSGSNVTKKMLWWNYFCNNYKDFTTNNCSKELFCNSFGQDGILWIEHGDIGMTGFVRDEFGCKICCRD